MIYHLLLYFFLLLKIDFFSLNISWLLFPFPLLILVLPFLPFHPDLLTFCFLLKNNSLLSHNGKIKHNKIKTNTSA